MRRRTTSSLLVVSIALLSFLFSDVTIAGGAWLTETGGADMAMAAAGSAALAADASTLAANPAGMVELQGNRLLITAMPLLLEIQGSGDGDTTGSINNQGGPTPAGALFATHSNGRWAAGLGLYSYLGLGFDYGRQWSGARAVQSADFVTINIAPAFAYRLNKRVSLGGSLSAQYASAQAKLAVANNLPLYGSPADSPDGQLRLEGDSWPWVAAASAPPIPTAPAPASAWPGPPRYPTTSNWICMAATSAPRSQPYCNRSAARAWI